MFDLISALADFCVIYFIIIPFTFNGAIRHIDFDINCWPSQILGVGLESL